MSNTTADQVACHGQSRGGLRVAGTPLSPGDLPCTTVVTAALYLGDSWRPAVAGLLGMAPLAVVAAVSGMSLMGVASAASTPHANATTAQACVTAVAPGALGQLKYPACLGD